MEVASRPPLEQLRDLPVEEPPESAAAVTEPQPATPPAGVPSTPAASPAGAARDPEQTGLNFVVPELFLAPGEKPTAVPAGTAAEAPADAQPGELVLEDPVVDDLLTSPAPPPAPSAAPTPPTPAAASLGSRPAPPTPAAPRPVPPARVPIARTPALTAAAAKLAAAGAASERSATKPTTRLKPVTVAMTTARAATVSAEETVPRPAPQTTPKAVPQSKTAPQSKTDTQLKTDGSPASRPTAAPVPKVEAPSLASWANARATAAKVSAGPAPRPPPPPVARVPSPATPKTTEADFTPAPAPAAPSMDRDFIARNQVVERYLSGRLPLKGATDFERFCHDHPELLDEIGLPERVNAGLRLLEASGKPEPWQERPPPLWQKPEVTLGLAAAVVILGLALAIVAGGSAGKSQRIAELQKQASERALDPATSRREIRLLPSRSGASNSPAITIGGSASGAQLADFKIDESRSPYHAFRVTIDRIDQGRVGIINNLAKDSNGHLRIALNSSALGPGNYQLTLEGLDWRGEPQPDSWVTIGIAR